MKKLLWASPICLLDTSSGLALSIREMLFQLKSYGYDIKVLSATNFDNPNGNTYLLEHKNYLDKNIGNFISINDETLSYITLVTQSIYRQHMQSYEEVQWLNQYNKLLHSFKPDIMFFYRDGLLEFEMGYQAKLLGIKTVSYLANSAYQGKRWIKDIDLIITDSKATSKMYKQKEGYDTTPVGKFIPKERYLEKENSKKHILFINPSLEKGVLIIIQLALALEKKRPDILFEVLESRGNWKKYLKDTSKTLRYEREVLSNVIITQNTNNMREVYGRARILLVPSLWFESAGRVIVEAQLNAIPVVGSGRGGSAEMIGDGGIIFDFSKEICSEPYDKLLPKEEIQKLIAIIERLYDDEKYYNNYSKKALKNYNINHSIDINTKKLINALENI